MQPTTYRVTRLTIAEISLIGLGGFFCIFGLTDLAWDSWRAGGFAAALSQYPYSMSAAFAQVLLGLAMAFVFWLASMKKRGSGLLELDGEGLIHVEGRRRRQWRWDELSTFKLAGRWVGRHIVFAVPGKANWLTGLEAANLGLPEGRLGRIQDIYDTPLEDIAATLNQYRERALAGPSETSAPPTSAE